MTAQIHAFRVFNKNFVLDVNSGSVLQLDDLAFDILKDYHPNSSEKVFQSLESKYPKSQIKEALEEIQKLKEVRY